MCPRGVHALAHVRRMRVCIRAPAHVQASCALVARKCARARTSTGGTHARTDLSARVHAHARLHSRLRTRACIRHAHMPLRVRVRLPAARVAVARVRERVRIFGKLRRMCVRTNVSCVVGTRRLCLPYASARACACACVRMRGNRALNECARARACAMRKVRVPRVCARACACGCTFPIASATRNCTRAHARWYVLRASACVCKLQFALAVCTHARAFCTCRVARAPACARARDCVCVYMRAWLRSCNWVADAPRAPARASALTRAVHTCHAHARGH